MCWNSQCVLTNLVPFFFFSLSLLWYCVKSDSQVPTFFFKGGNEGDRKTRSRLSVSGRVWKLSSSCDFGQNTAYAFVHSKMIRLIHSFCWWKLPAISHMWWFMALWLAWVLVSLPTTMCGVNGLWCSASYFRFLDFCGTMMESDLIKCDSSWYI